MLSGHTHGGQICLPGGVPLKLNAVVPRRLGAGSWHYKGLTGYTSRGVGTSIVPAGNHATQVSGRLTVLVGGVSPTHVMQERGQHDVSDPESHCHDDYVRNRKIEGGRQDEARQQSFGDLIQTRSTPT